MSDLFRVRRDCAYGLFDSARLLGRDLVFGGKYFSNRIGRKSGDQPIILCNSYPKSGTHLLFQILTAIPGVESAPDIVSVQAFSGTMNSLHHIRWKLGGVSPGRVVPTHLMHSPEILTMLSGLPHRRVHILRDLRDVAVSHARWVCREPRDFLHKIYTQTLTTDDQRLMASIQGTPLGSPFGSNVSQPPIGQNFSRWQGWLDDTDTLVVRFEDLVGERGGGSDQKRYEAISGILAHLNVTLSAEEIEENFSLEKLNPNRMHTFFKGNIGTWRTAFNDTHKEAFKKVAGDILIQTGYESTLEW